MADKLEIYKAGWHLDSGVWQSWGRISLFLGNLRSSEPDWTRLMYSVESHCPFQLTGVGDIHNYWTPPQHLPDECWLSNWALKSCLHSEVSITWLWLVSSYRTRIENPRQYDWETLKYPLSRPVCYFSRCSDNIPEQSNFREERLLLTVLMSIWQKLGWFGRGNLNWSKVSYQIGLRARLGCIFLTDDWCRKGLSQYRWCSKKARWASQWAVLLHALCITFNLWLWLPQWRSVLRNHRLKSFPKFLLVMVLYPSSRSPKMV